MGLLCCMMLGIDAQTTVEDIRKAYNSIKDELAEMMKEDGMPAAYCQLHVAQNLPGTGPHFEDVLFYWGDNDDDEIYPTHYVRYASTKYNYAAREFYEEYMFDQQGNTLFIYARTPDFDFANGLIYDFRFYFNKGKVMSVIVKSSADGGKTFKEVYSGNNVSKQYTDEFKRCISASKKYKRLYDSIDNCTLH